ncbi:MAG: hypothetical protein AAF711_02005 [Planctomycetota bacterium]
MGINGVRFWDGPALVEYKAGDGSYTDSSDYFIAEAKRRGFRIWMAGMNRMGGASPDDVDIVDDPSTAADWSLAVSQGMRQKGPKPRNPAFPGWRLNGNLAVLWDDRLEAIRIRNMQAIATHFNEHTGLRYCDDPVFAIWELSNEEWWVRKMVGGNWQRLPEYFRTTLQQRWNEHLLKKYGTQGRLIEAWGELKPGESLENGTVLFAPMARAVKTETLLNDTNPFAAEAVAVMESEYGPDDFSKARGEDVMAFLVELHVGHKKRVAAAIKPLGRGTQLSPMIYDTGIGYQIQSQWMHQNADAVAHDAYINGWGPSLESQMEKLDPEAHPLKQKLDLLHAERMSANDGPWVNWLRKPPGISQGVPWLEHNRVEGMPFLCYETQIQQPAKYRADYPLRLAALASIQDWDWITWHYFGDGSLNQAGVVDRPFEKPMDVKVGRHPQGYHFTYDEVQTGIMRAAGYMFRNFAWDPAPNPTRFIYGRKSLVDPLSMNYAHSYGLRGMDMFQTVYQHGVRIEIDPSREDDEIIGPVVRFADRNTHNPYQPTDQITFDHQQGFMRVVAPAGVAFAGNVDAGQSMSLGPVTVSDLRVHNPKGIYDPIDESNPYLAFSVYSVDGRPLEDSRHAGVSIASTSFNTGFGIARQEGNQLYAKRGTLPVLVARPAATFRIPAFAGGTYTMLNFHGEVVGRGRISDDGTLVLKHTQPAWFIDLRR